MATTTLNKTPRTLVAAGTTQTAGAGNYTRGTLDLRTAQGGILTMKITNGATGPATQCEGRVLIAHNSGSTPTASSEGADWKTIYRFGGGIVNSDVTPQSLNISPGVMHLEIEFNGNTTQNVTVEAYFSEITSAASA